MNAPDANTLFRHAQMLMRQGQPVFPCRPVDLDDRKRAKAPLTRNGLHDASLEVDQVKRWWKANGSAAIGIPTGIIWDVLDVDVKHGQDGRVHLPYLQRLGLLNGCQRLVKTPSGGWHLYFAAANGLTNRASASMGLDVRAKGGYVLAPPSFIHTDEYRGAYTEHETPTGGTDEPLFWDLIASAIEPVDVTTRQPVVLLRSEQRASVAALRAWLSDRQSGERNNALHWAVCRCIDSNIDPYELFEVAIHIGLSEAETRLTMDSALRRAGLSVDELDSEMEALFPEED